MLDGDHYRTQELVSQLLTNAQMSHALELVKSLEPVLYRGLNGEYRYLLKSADIDVSGTTLHLAVLAFERAFYNQK